MSVSFGPTGTYGGLALAIAAQSSTLPSGGLDFIGEKLAAGAAYTDDPGFSFSNYSPTNRITVRAKAGSEHNGTVGSGIKWVGTSGRTFGLAGLQDYIELIQLELSNSLGDQNLVYGNGNTATNNLTKLTNCLFWSTSANAIGGGGTNNNFRADCSVFWAKNSGVRPADVRGGPSQFLNRCVFMGNAPDFSCIGDGNTTATGCVALGSTGGDFRNFTGGSYNASVDGSAASGFTNGLTGITSALFISVTAGSENWNLQTGTNALVDSGTAISGVSTDFIGTSIPQGATPDRGACERIFVGGATPWQKFTQDNQPQPDTRQAVAI